jgi:hypothetical protein
MDKELATSILNQAMKINKELGTFDSIVSSIEDEATKKTYAKALGNLIGIVAFYLIAPVVQEYPELEPYKDEN